MLLLSSLLVAGCTHQPPPPPSVGIAKISAATPVLVLKPADLRSSAPSSASVLTVDSWLDEYFSAYRSIEKELHHAALAAHPEWAPQIEAMRRVSVENENVARAAFIHLHRTGTDGIYWSDGEWIWAVLPCNCGKIHNIESPDSEVRVQQPTAAHIALERVSTKQFRDAYNLAVSHTRQSIKPEWKTQLDRLKPGFLRFMREPNRNGAHN
jgi:hypothetical protein